MEFCNKKIEIFKTKEVSSNEFFEIFDGIKIFILESIKVEDGFKTESHDCTEFFDEGRGEEETLARGD